MSRIFVNATVEELKKAAVEEIHSVLLKTTTEKRNISIGLSGILDLLNDLPDMYFLCRWFNADAGFSRHLGIKRC